MRTYELALIIHPDLDEPARDKLLDLIEKIVKHLKGEINKREIGGKKTLAYPVVKQTEGWYYYLHLSLPAEAINKLSDKIKIEDQVMRFLILAKEQKNQKTNKAKS